MDPNKSDTVMFGIGAATVAAILGGITFGIVWSNHDTNVQWNKCIQVAAQNHMYADCPDHLISKDPINWPMHSSDN